MRLRLRRKSLDTNGVQIFAYIFLTIMTFIFIFPLISAIMVSISDEDAILRDGYKLIPSKFSLEAYKLLFTNYGKSMGRSLVITISSGVIQPLLSILLCVSLAYPLSQPDFIGRDFWRKFLVTTMLFSAGLVPTYILKSRYFGLSDTYTVYIVPAVGAWTVFLFRTFFVNIDKAMIESAKIDGATNYRILFSIMIPLTKPLVVMNFFKTFLNRWNDITTPLYYIRKPELFTIQYLLQQMIGEAKAAQELLELGMGTGSTILENYPIESTKFALAVIGALPVFIMFPYLQKYYAKGIMIGSTKG